MSMIDEIRERMCAVRIEDGEITGAELVEQGDAESIPGLPVKNLPEHIKVSVTCRPEEGSNIKIEVWMPVQGWNGDLVGVGNGGAAGAILSFMMAEPLRQGFAVATTDLGTSAGADCGIGNKAVWKDFGHRATHAGGERDRQGLVWEIPRLFLLQRGIYRGAAGADGGPAVSRRLRRNSGLRSGL